MSSHQSLGRRKRPRTKGSQSTDTRRTGPYCRGFLQHLIDFHVLPPEYEYPDGTVPSAPTNLDKIITALSRDPISQSPSEHTAGDFRKLRRANMYAFKEADLTLAVIPILEGDCGDRRCAAGQIPFLNLDYLTDGSIVPGNPDRYYGARPEQLNQGIRKELEGQIMPSTQRDLPIAPNFFLHVKGPDGTAAVAMRQVCYDGALGARGMKCLQKYAGVEKDVDGKAYTLTCVYQSGQLTMYACHPIPSKEPGGPPGYAMTQLEAFAMTGNQESFQRGVAAYRNGQNWAKQQRDAIIKQANDAYDDRLRAASTGD